VDFDENALPEIAIADFLVRPAPEQKPDDQHKGTVIYCIDISGSMSLTEKVPELQGNITVNFVNSLYLTDINRYLTVVIPLTQIL